ncbi:MAG: hypothetical protein LJE65_01320 [Desulfobacteraceae bacterium]|nr:hypothetical protein [Desulfobacteraceae bacterium]
MKRLLCLRAYRTGYTGLIESPEAYALFRYSRSRGFFRLQTFPAQEFRNRKHFLSVVTKTIGTGGFLERPVPVQGPSLVELDRIMGYSLGPR